MTNFRGYDIAPDMVRLSRVNLYLHSFANPVIHEYDTLTSEERWDERCDVIMANPPFMTPKGGIRPHNRFSIKAKRSEVLFVDYIAEHLTPGGRAGIIVPEGIIFQSQNAYKALRKMLVENYLWCVVSLPAGVFNPYSGVKTSILLLDRNLVKRTDEVLFVKIENDGFDLGAQRRPIGKNDLPDALAAILSFRESCDSSRPEDAGREKAPKSQEKTILVVPRKRVLESPDVNLSGDRYRETVRVGKTRWPMVKLGAVSELIGGGTPSKTKKGFWTNGTIKWISAKHISEEDTVVGWDLITERAVKESATNVIPANAVVVVTRVSVGKMTLLDEPTAVNQDLTGLVVRDSTKLRASFLYWVLKYHAAKIADSAQGLGVRGVTRQFMADIQIPLPPLEEQERIVAELEGYRKVIEGARQVLANYRPVIAIGPKWPLRPIGELAELFSGGTPSKARADYWDGAVPWVSPKDMKTDVISDTEDHISEGAITDSAVNRVPAGAILCVVRSGILAHTFPVAIAAQSLTFNQDITALVVDPQKIKFEWLFHILRAMEADVLGRGTKRGGTVHSLQNGFLRALNIPLPPLHIQRQIVEEIEAERKLVDANRELIGRMEAKIQTRLAEIWGGSGDAA